MSARTDFDGVLVIGAGLAGLSAALAAAGEVGAAATRAGRAVATTHWGPYEELGAAHRAIAGWIAAQGLASRVNWEVYGDWADDPAQRRTDVFHLIEEGVRP